MSLWQVFRLRLLDRVLSQCDMIVMRMVNWQFRNIIDPVKIKNVEKCIIDKHLWLTNLAMSIIPLAEEAELFICAAENSADIALKMNVSPVVWKTHAVLILGECIYKSSSVAVIEYVLSKIEMGECHEHFICLTILRRNRFDLVKKSDILRKIVHDNFIPVINDIDDDIFYFNV